jgi:ATP-dependent DNA helicase RecQ
MFRIKRHAKQAYLALFWKNGCCEFVPYAKKQQDNTSLASAIVTLLQSENLNSRDIQNRTKNNSEVIAVLQYLLKQHNFG